MKYAVAGFVVLSLASIIVFAQTPNQTLKICQGLPIPEGYIIVAYENSPSCTHGAYVLKKEDKVTVSRPRKVGNAILNSTTLNLPEEISTSYERPTVVRLGSAWTNRMWL